MFAWRSSVPVLVLWCILTTVSCLEDVAKCQKLLRSSMKSSESKMKNWRKKVGKAQKLCCHFSNCMELDYPLHGQCVLMKWSRRGIAAGKQAVVSLTSVATIQRAPPDKWSSKRLIDLSSWTPLEDLWMAEWCVQQKQGFRSCTVRFSCDLCSSFTSWANSGGEEAFNTGLNVTYQEKDGRSIYCVSVGLCFWKSDFDLRKEGVAVLAYWVEKAKSGFTVGGGRGSH